MTVDKLIFPAQGAFLLDLSALTFVLSVVLSS